MSVIQTAISSIRKKAGEMFNDNQGFFQQGKFTTQPIQQSKVAQATKQVLSQGLNNAFNPYARIAEGRSLAPMQQNTQVNYSQPLKIGADIVNQGLKNYLSGSTFNLIEPKMGNAQTTAGKVTGIGTNLLGAFTSPASKLVFGKTGKAGENLTRNATMRFAPKLAGTLASKVLPQIGSELAQTLSYAGLSKLGNKIGLNEQQNQFSPGSLATNMAVGLGFRAVPSIVSKVVNDKVVVHPEDVNWLERANDTLRSKKSTAQQIQDAKNVIYSLAENYMTEPERVALSDNPKLLARRLIKYAGDVVGKDVVGPPVMGIVDKSQGLIPEGKGRLKIKPVVQQSLDKIGEVKNTLSKSEVAPPLKTLSQIEPLKVEDQSLRSPSLENNIPQDPVDKLMMALKEAKPLRGQQEAIYRQQRAIKVARAGAMGEKVGGEKGYFAQLGQLKGEMPKVQFESLRKNLTQPDVDSLFNKVETSALPVFDKINAKTALSKLLGAEGGTVPTRSELKLLNEIFPPEFIQTVLDKRPLMQRLWSGAEQVLNLPQSMMSTLDLSAPLRQGALLVGRPKQWLPAFRDMFKYAGSENAYKGLQENIRSRPTYNAMREAKLAITDIGPDILGREEAFLSNLSEKIPIFGRLSKASNRAYSGFLNKLRADTFDDLLAKSKELGVYDQNPAIINDIAKFVNNATGRGDLGGLNKSAPILNSIFFSPRLMASRVQTLNPMYYVNLDPFVRKEALRSLLGFGSVALSLVGLSRLGGAEVGTDPRSADFGKIKIGDTRYDPWGGFQQYIVLASRLASGEMVNSTTGKEFKLGEGYKPTTRLDIIQRFLESKESPVVSFATSLLKGQTSMGEPVNVPAEVIDRFIPMMAQDIADLTQEYGAKGIAMAIPGMFGVGSQTYTDQIPIKGKTATGKENIQWRTQPGLGEKIINKITGTTLSNVPQEDWKPLYEAKMNKATNEARLNNIKREVLDSGNSQDFYDAYKNKMIKVYLKDGVVKTSESSVVKPAGATDNLSLPSSSNIDEITYTNENGNDAKIVLSKLDNIAKLPSTNKYETAIKESKIYSSASSILDNTNLSAEQQQLALKRLGVDPTKASYYQIANDDTNKKTMYVLDAVNKVKSQGGQFSDVVKLLSDQRQDINGQMIASNAVLDNLVDEGVLSKSQATQLKKYKLEDGKLTPIKKLTVGKSKKIKISKPKKIAIKKLPKMRVYKPKPLKLKFKKSKPVKIKLQRIKKNGK